MIIKELTLHNFAVYAGTNTYTFSGDKPVVLIGGKNGRGKTSFLTAILLTLFGRKSYSFVSSDFTAYTKYLKSFANVDHESYDETYVEIVFEEDRESHVEYRIRRSWNGKLTAVKENISVYKNGEQSEFLAKNWNLYIESIIPSALAPFFFFDGEIISEYAVDTNNEQLKESIKALLGINVLDQLDKDIHKIRTKAEKKINVLASDANVNELKEECDQLVLQIGECEQSILDLEQFLTEKKEAIELAKSDYLMEGGAVREELKRLSEVKSNLQSDLEIGKRDLIAITGSALPLYLVKDMLCDIEKEVAKEKDIKVNQITMNRLESIFESYAAAGEHSMELTKFMEFAKQKVEMVDGELTYNMPEHVYYRLQELVRGELDDLAERTRQIRKSVRQKERQLDEVNDHLNMVVNDDKVDASLKDIGKFETEIEQLLEQKKNLELKKSEINGDYRTKFAEYKARVNEILGSIDQQDDNKRICDYAERANTVLKRYKQKLQEKKIQTLAETATLCFARLANKTSPLIIDIDPIDLNIRYLNENGIEINKYGLSAGEKQLVVISILWSLAICSSKKLPVIIDTPLSRMDREHRNSIIKEYFPNASIQTIILSTDSEINETNYHLIKEYVGDEYSLSYDDQTRKSTIVKGYRFGGE